MSIMAHYESMKEYVSKILYMSGFFKVVLTEEHVEVGNSAIDPLDTDKALISFISPKKLLQKARIN